MMHKTAIPACSTFLILTLVLILSAARSAQAQTETVLYNFTGGSDGGNPESALTPDGHGNFFGTTAYGGLGYGTVFELSPTGNGGWNETVIYSFTGGTDGANPFYAGVMLDRLGNLYGTTQYGGDLACNAAQGCGVVFKLIPAGGTSWTETVLYSFANDGDGRFPGDSVIMDPAGNLYGINSAGVFELIPSGRSWTEQVIYTFDIYIVGHSGLTMDAAGNIFGTTGTRSVFELSPNGNGGWTPTVICTLPFNYYTVGTLTLDQAGNLYGSANHSGAVSYGTVYELILVTKGKNKGKYRRTVLHSFKGSGVALYSLGGVVLDAAGNIYGTTVYGGEYGNYPTGGTVFELVAPIGTGGYTEKILWSFDSTDGSNPSNAPILDTSGNIYGTTYEGGEYGYGVIYEITP